MIASLHLGAREAYRDNHDGIMNDRVSALRVMVAVEPRFSSNGIETPRHANRLEQRPIRRESEVTRAPRPCRGSALQAGVTGSIPVPPTAPSPDGNPSGIEDAVRSVVARWSPGT